MDDFVELIVFALIYVLFLYRRWRKGSVQGLVMKSLMYLYIVMVVFVTLMPFPMPFGATNNMFMDTANFIPFRDIALNYDGAAREIVLNVIMMVPFGFLYPIIRKKGIVHTMARTFLFSVIIEATQLLSAWWGSLHSRSFDVTDLITNTFGGCIGYLIYIASKPLIHKIVKE